jgi:hypothetical protein
MNEGEPVGELGPLPTRPKPYSSSLLAKGGSCTE